MKHSFGAMLAYQVNAYENYYGCRSSGGALACRNGCSAVARLLLKAGSTNTGRSPRTSTVFALGCSR